jgi:hypothetical protein
VFRLKDPIGWVLECFGIDPSLRSGRRQEQLQQEHGIRHTTGQVTETG